MSGSDPKHPENGFAAFEQTAQRVEEAAEMKPETGADGEPSNVDAIGQVAADQLSSTGHAAADKVESAAARAAEKLEATGNAGAERVEAVVGSMAEGVRNVGGGIAEHTRELTEKASVYANQAGDQLSRARASATNAVTQGPLVALLVAGTVGLVLGLLANSRR